jgi:hypothetical protein
VRTHPGILSLLLSSAVTAHVDVWWWGGGGDAIFSATTVIEAILIAHLCLDKFDAIIDGYDLVKTRCREAALGYGGPSW